MSKPDRADHSAERDRLMNMKGEDVHASDAPGNDEERAPLERKSGREDAVEAIAVSRRQQMADELGLETLEPIDDKPARDEQGRFTEGNQAPEPEEEHESEPEMVRVVIYGEERMVPAAEVEEAGGVRAYQMNKAAEVNFQRSKEALEEARHLREEQATRAHEPRQASEDDIGEDGLTQDQRDDLAQMQDEYGEEVIDTRRRTLVLENRIARQTSGDSDPTFVDRVADQLERRNKEREEAARQKLFNEQREQADSYFSTHYAHIESDPDLNLIAQAKARELVAANQQRSLMDVVKEVGEYINGRYVRHDGRAGPLARRVERKRSTSRAPAPSASMRVSPAPEPEPEGAQTPQSVVHQIQRARHQA